MNMNNPIMHNAILGLAIGDALGVPYEFLNRNTFTCSGMASGGFHDQPAGTWSDDTSMMLATLKSLVDNDGKIVISDIRNNFLRWMKDGDFAVDGDVFDMGVATSKALRTGKPCGGEYDNGNGSLMRILPLAFTDCTDEEIRQVSAITHSHWISKEACVIYVHVARRLIAGENIVDILPTLQYGKPFHRLRLINELETYEIRSTGYVVDTLEAALWAVSHKWRDGESSASREKSFANDVLAAVNLGKDTDTVGAVTGGLAGIIYGMESPECSKWISQLRGMDVIEGCFNGKNTLQGTKDEQDDLNDREKQKLIDVHTHITPNVDDGSLSIEMSLEMLKSEVMQGATAVFLTPHSFTYRGPEYIYTQMDRVQQAAAAAGISVQICQGCEIYTRREDIEEILADLKEGKLPSMNKSRYVMVEFDTYYGRLEDAKYCLRRYIEEGWIPIIAHAERYGKTFAIVENIRILKEMGCLVQVNYYDLSQESNDEIRRLAQAFLQAELVDMMGSDAHRMDHRKPELKCGAEYIREHCRAEYAEDILWRNAERMLLAG